MTAPSAAKRAHVQSHGAASGLCPNCGADAPDAFCPRCGQRQGELRLTFRELLHELADEVLHVESRVPRTLGALVASPGSLTRQYWDGRRARYIGPVRLYLVASFLYFLIASLTPTRISMSASSEAERPSASASLKAELGKSRAALDEQLAQAPPWVRRLVKPFADAQAHPELVPRMIGHALESVLHYLPRAMFVLIPTFALILQLLYRQHLYAEHFVFALHFHALAFLVFSLKELAPWERVQELLGATLLVYLLAALKRAYADGWRKTCLKASALVVAYGAVLLVAFCGMFLAGIYTWA